jgi:hypothetical protein
MGVVVTGTGSGHTQFLLHMTSASTAIDNEFNKFEEDMRKTNLSHMRGYISTPDTNHQTPATWDAEMKKPSDEVEALLKEKVTALVGSAPTVVTRPMALAINQGPSHGMMSADKGKNIEIEGRRVW